jgi:hypothetical protein
MDAAPPPPVTARDTVIIETMTRLQQHVPMLAGATVERGPMGSWVLDLRPARKLVVDGNNARQPELAPRWTIIAYGDGGCLVGDRWEPDVAVAEMTAVLNAWDQKSKRAQTLPTAAQWTVTI